MLPRHQKIVCEPLASPPGMKPSSTKGFMPMKGGRPDLSDDEIKAGVDYLVGESD